MQQLEALTAQAAALADGSASRVCTDSSRREEDEAARLLRICNACRYCEGFCAVFPAMTRRLQFEPDDIHYLANLCHNCGACLHACQYAPPHEFQVNVPRTLAKVRATTYQHHAWPAALGALYGRNGLVLALAVSLSLALFLVFGITQRNGVLFRPLTGHFYAVFPHNTLALLFGTVFGFAALSLTIGVRRFWRSVTPGSATAAAVAESAGSVLGLRYLGGGHGEGCNEEDDRFTLWRRRFHHFTFYGFFLCFAATVVATGYHYVLEREAPYDYLSIPVLLGSTGGLGLLIGLTGQLYLALRRNPKQYDTNQQPMDRGFIALLYLTTLTGFGLLVGRNSAAMGLLLAVHLGAVLGLFLTLPYGKFAHGVYRSAALLKYAIERRQPNTLELGDG